MSKKCKQIRQWYIRVDYDGSLHPEPAPFLDMKNSRMTPTLFETRAEAEAAIALALLL